MRLSLFLIASFALASGSCPLPPAPVPVPSPSLPPLPPQFPPDCRRPGEECSAGQECVDSGVPGIPGVWYCRPIQPPSPAPSPSPSATPAPVPSPSPCVIASPNPRGCLPEREPDECWMPFSRLEWEVGNNNWVRVRPRLYRWDRPSKPPVFMACDGQSWRAACWVSDADGQPLPSGGGGRGMRTPADVFGQWPENSQGVCPAFPCPVATPCPSPTPGPTPSPQPAPSGAPPIDPVTGNYPMPPEGVCPAWFADAVSHVGISVLTQRKCQGRDAPPDCTVTVLNATEKSAKPFCPHAPDRLQCETWRPCQQPPVVNGNSGIQMLIAHPDWNNEFGACDKRSVEGPFPDPRSNFLCHDRAENRGGVTRAKACEPDGTRCGAVIEYRSLP